jgi:transcriptional regulator with XRE-family HTH domain
MAEGRKQKVPYCDLPYALDYRAWLTAVKEALAEGGSNMNQMCQMLGISHGTLSNVRLGRNNKKSLNANTLINIVAWSGVDVKPFVIDNDASSTPVTTLADVHPENYVDALRVIAALRERLSSR